jgi:hypothetical protein
MPQRAALYVELAMKSHWQLRIRDGNAANNNSSESGKIMKERPIYET